MLYIIHKIINESNWYIIIKMIAMFNKCFIILNVQKLSVLEIENH